MASILDRYGIKEVADVTFYEIDSNGQPGKPVLYLDTLKVSTIEQTAESVDARGGKGNPKLVTWDYGKEISVTLEDALFSAKSMSISMANGSVSQDTAYDVERVVMVRCTTASALPSYFVADVYDANQGSARKRVWTAAASDMPQTSDYVALASSGLTIEAVWDEAGTTSYASYAAAASSAVAGQKYFVRYKAKATTKTLTISGDSFPGTYYVTGDTYARSDVDGKDQFFQFIIPKAKLQAQQTITLQAEGDPSVFNMNLTVLRPEDGDMMKLVQYDLNAPA